MKFLWSEIQYKTGNLNVHALSLENEANLKYKIFNYLIAVSFTFKK